MSFVKFFSYNLASQPTTLITATDEDAFFPAINIKDPRHTKVYRTPEGTEDAEIVFDFITTEAVSSVLVKAGMEGFGLQGDITIEANATNVWTSPAFSITLTPNDEFGYGFVTFPEENYRFWRLTFSNPGGDYAELSKVFIGKEVQLLTNNIRFGWRYERNDISRIIKNRYGERFFDEIITLGSINASFTLLNVSELEQLLDMFNYNRKTIPVWFLTDEDAEFSDDPHRFLIYGFFPSIPTVTNNHPSLYDLSFEIEE